MAELTVEETKQAAEDRRKRYIEALIPADEAVRIASPPEWLVESILPAGAVVVVAGLAKKARKTYTMLELLSAVAAGRPFLGQYVTRRGAVCMANLEDGANRLGWRLKQLRGDREPRREPLYLLRSRDDLALFMACLDDPSPAIHTDLAVIDPLVECAQLRGLKDENDPLEMVAAVQPFREAVQKTRKSIVVVHHFRKAGDIARGSSALQGAVDGWWDIFPVEGEPQLTHVEVTLRDGPPVEFGIRTVFSPEGKVTLEYVDPQQTRSQKESVSKRGRKGLSDNQLRLEIVQALNEDGPLSGSKLEAAVGHKRKRVREVVETMVSEGVLTYDFGVKKYTLCLQPASGSLLLPTDK